MKKSHKIIITPILLTFLIGCVPSRKFNDLKASKIQVMDENNQLKKENGELKEANTSLMEENAELTETNQGLTNDLALAKERYDLLDKAQRDLNDRYDRLLSINDQLTSSAAGEKKKLMEELSRNQRELDKKTNELNDKTRNLQDLQRQLATKEKEIAQAQAKLEADKAALQRQVLEFQGKVSALESNVGELQGDLAEREKRVKELETLIQSQEAKMKALQDRLNGALLNFSSEDLTITRRDGKVYISLSQNLLFKSGSKTINTDGKKALSQLATVLASNPDLDIMVEGHTDSDGDEGSNWDLSVMRATSIIKHLTKNGVSPKQITAAGRGEFFPIAPNTTSNGKAQNRRTEIILSPNLKDLYDMMN